MTMKTQVTGISGLVAAAGLIPIACFTSDLAARETEEIVVTVRKTTENIQDVPIQITAFSEEILRSENVRDTADVARLTPSLQFDQGFWPSDTRVSIRGLFARSGRPSAAVLIDGIDVNSEAFESSGGSALLNQRLIDLERVEVARGPQAALYGRAAFSGGINYVTKRPPEEFEVNTNGQVAERGRVELRASLGGPLIEDTLSANIIGSYYELDGDYTNPNTNGKLGGGDSKGIGFGLNWTPSDRLGVYWNTTYSEDEFAPQAVALVTANTFRIVQNIGSDGVLIPNSIPDPINSPASAGCDINRVNPLNPGQVGDSCLWTYSGVVKADEGMIDIAPDPRTGKDFPGTKDEIFRSYVIVDFDISDALAFRSSTSYTDSDQSINFDSTQTSFLPTFANTFGLPSGNFADANNEFEFRQIYQEFQLSGNAGESINWLAGLNAFLEEGSDRNTSRFWYRNPAICGFLVGAACSFADSEQFDKSVDRDTTSYSVFGLVGWQLAERWKLTLEGRLIRDEVEVTADNTTLGADALSDPFFYDPVTFPGFTGSVSDTNFTPRVSLDFVPADQLLLYGSVAKGIKPPTFNTTDLVSAQVNSVGTETLWTYELGAKSTLRDGTLLLNGAVFYNDYKDQQTRVQFPPRAGGGIPTSGAVNAGTVTVWGVEIDATWLPTDRWSVSASYAYTNGEFDDFVLAEAQAPTGVNLSRSEIARAGNLQADFTGNDTPGNPEHAASLLARYQAPVYGNTDWYAQGSATYQGKRWADAANLVELESYFLVNGQIGLQQDNWFVSVFVENMFDDDTVRYAQQFIDQGQGFQTNTLSFPGGYFAYLPQPRTTGVRFSYSVK
jgi:outer membrane receptor protein involved in Fe transport